MGFPLLKGKTSLLKLLSLLLNLLLIRDQVLL